jgi:hypothetical protein
VIVSTVATTEPLGHGLPGHGWTLKKLRRWMQAVFGRCVSRSSLRALLKTGGLSWKKCKKLLKKADPQQRAAYVEQFQALFERMCGGTVRLVYVDQAHLHQDLDLGYTWAPVGQPVWRESLSPSLAARINWYGAYDFSTGQCFVWQEGKCNGAHTAQFLRRLMAWLDESDPQSKRQVVVIWDGAPWHRSQGVRTQAAELGIQLVPLPGYSPDLNPIEGLWKWMRQEVTQHYCHTSLHELCLACHAFVARINRDPLALVTRLWPKFDLDPDYEKLLLST